jgi:hypothetical protein
MIGPFTADIFPPLYSTKGYGPQSLITFGIRSVNLTIVDLKINMGALFQKYLGLEIHPILAVVEHFGIERFFSVKTAPRNGRFTSVPFIGSFFHKPLNLL